MSASSLSNVNNQNFRAEVLEGARVLIHSDVGSVAGLLNALSVIPDELVAEVIHCARQIANLGPEYYFKTAIIDVLDRTREQDVSAMIQCAKRFYRPDVRISAGRLVGLIERLWQVEASVRNEVVDQMILRSHDLHRRVCTVISDSEFREIVTRARSRWQLDLGPVVYKK